MNPYQIDKVTNHLNGRKNRSAIFAEFRKVDDSHLWPVCNKFNATNRAINRLYRFEKQAGYYLLGLELCLFLENEISNIVNNQI